MSLLKKLPTVRRPDFFMDVVVSFLVKGLGGTSAFIASVAIGRQLGAEDAGYYFLSFSIVLVLSAFSRMGLDKTVVRFTGAAMPDNEWNLIRQAFYRAISLILALSIFIATMVYLSSDYIAQSVFSKPELAGVLRAMSPGIVGFSVLTNIAMFLQGLRKFKASLLIIGILVNCLLIASIWFVSTPEQVAWIYSGSTLLVAAFAYYLLQRSLGTGGGQISWQQLFTSCLPLWIVVIMSQTTQFSGQFVAGAWVDAEEIAQLAVAQRTAMLTSFVLLAVNMVIAPRFASMYKQGKSRELEKTALDAVKLMLVIVSPIVAFLMIYPEWVMSFFGDGFVEGALFLQILVVGQFVNVATGSVGNLLMMSGHERDLRNAVLISGPVALILAFTLIPVFGAIGSAVATAVAVGMQNLIAVWCVKKRLGFNTLAIWR